jgi:peptidoglycan/xylan/chitin deacetylase (PgdA/CDA1 family)
LRNTIQRKRVTIIIYHDPDPELFARHLKQLRRRYKCVRLRDLAAAIRSGSGWPLPAKALIITFDDGHSGNFRLMEVVRRYGVPVTIFLCTDIVGTTRGFWFKHVDRAEALRAVPDRDRLAFLESYGFDPDAPRPDRDALSDGEIREMTGPLVDFQSHTASHPILTQCADAKARAEIFDSRRVLIEKYGFDAYAIAYPNGAHSDRVVQIARDAGYSCGLTTERGFNSPRTDPLRLRRIGIGDQDGIDALVVKSSGFWRVFERTRRPIDAVGDRVTRSRKPQCAVQSR